MVNLRAAFFAALCIFQNANSAAAQDITLTARDGAVEINGTLLGYDGEFYRVDTIFGQLTVDGTGVSCEGPACPSLTDYVAELRVSGAGSMAEVLLPALVESFAVRNGYTILRDASNPGLLLYELTQQRSDKTVARFAIRSTTTEEGFADLIANEADIAMSLREVRDVEASRSAESGLGDLTRDNRSRVLAHSALVPVVESSNPIREISALQLAAVFSGQITNWQELGGPDAPIVLHLPAPGSGLLQAIEDRLMVPAGLAFDDTIRFHSHVSALVRSIQFDPFAIGISTYERTGAARTLRLSGGCGYAIAATRQGIKTEDYPLATPLYLYVPALRQPKIVREFLTYVRSRSAQVVIRRAGFVDQATESVPISQQGQRLSNAIGQAGTAVSLSTVQEMVAFLRDKLRLTTTFRFKTGGADLDAHSTSNVQILAERLERGDYDDQELVFVGFSDGSGSSDANQIVATQRAEAVKNAVQIAATALDPSRVKLSSIGFGEALPIACDDSAWGRRVNRRVEVWVR